MFIEFACENCNKFYGFMFSLPEQEKTNKRWNERTMLHLPSNAIKKMYRHIRAPNKTRRDNTFVRPKWPFLCARGLYANKRTTLSGFSVNFHECQSWKQEEGVNSMQELLTETNRNWSNNRNEKSSPLRLSAADPKRQSCTCARLHWSKKL